MANKTIPELTEKLQLEPSDLLIVHGSGQTKKTNFYNALSLSAKNVTGSTKHISEWLSDVNDNTLKIILLSANNTGIDTEVRALTSNWQSTYTNYTSNSSSYTTNSTVNSISSQLVLTSDFNNYKTNVASTTATLLPTTIYRSASGDWQSTYTTVRSNSAFWASNIDTGVRALTGNWQNASTVVQTNSAFWASNIDTGVRALTGNWESTYNTFKTLSSTFLTSETDSQTLSFNEGTKDLSISNGNTVSLSALIDVGSTGIDTEVRTLTGNWESTYTTVQSNSAQWASNIDTGVRALTGNWDKAYEMSSAYSLISSTFLTSETDSQTLSFNELNKQLSISNGNTISLSALTDLTSVDTEVRSLTSNWESTYTTVQSNSAQWASNVDTEVRSLTSNWESTYTTVQSNSAQWASNVDTEVRALSSNWQSAYTTYSGNSSIYVKTVVTTTPGTSAVSTIVAVSALPVSPDPNTLYIVI
jgi:hypothetical protein